MTIDNDGHEMQRVIAGLKPHLFLLPRRQNCIPYRAFCCAECFELLPQPENRRDAANEIAY